MDHGELNIPLAKRGDIDRQLDAHFAKQEAAAKVVRKANAQLIREQREQAKAVLAAMPEEQLARIAAKAGITPKRAAKRLQGVAYFTPKQMIALRTD
jgi:hypothetical protein